MADSDSDSVRHVEDIQPEIASKPEEGRGPFDSDSEMSEREPLSPMGEKASSLREKLQ